MFCKKCGGELSENAKFCGKCGAAVDCSSAPVKSVSPAPKVKGEEKKAPEERRAKKSKLPAVLITALVLIAVFSIGGYFLITSNKDAKRSGNNTNIKQEANDNALRGTHVSVSEDGELKIKRVQLGDEPMGADGTYTVFVYMCGSDLESGNQNHNGGFATADIQEMVNASSNENVRFVIQTGGSATWQNDVVKAGEIGRYEIYGGKIYNLDSQPDASMGDTDTLSAFLEWGVEYAPAAKMGLVFWNHGGGSITGVCVDAVKRDILTLAEIDNALAEASKKMTDKFEFIGFDACLMATVECANILSPYAEYMYASEEVEPGSGWDYTAIGKYLNQNPNTGGDALGKKVADSYYAQNNVPMVTFSVIDLSKVDDLVLCLNNYAKELNAASQDYKTFAMVVRGILDAENFGTNNSSGYTNMVDLAGIVNAGAEYANGAKEVLNAIDNAVVYFINGGIHSDACGLSTYYPLAVASNEINTFNNIAVCPYYMAFVSRTVYAIEHDSSMKGYDEDEIVKVWTETWAEEETSAAAEHYWDEYEDTQITGNSPLFQFEIEPSYRDFGSDGEPEFGFLLDEQSYYNLASISTHTWKYLPEEGILIDLGIRDAGWIKSHREKSVTCDATGGYHTHYLKDGQPFPQYKLLGNKYDAYAFDTSVYVTPVLLNGEPTYLLSGKNIGGNQTDINGKPKLALGSDCIWGAWASVSEDGTMDRAQVVKVNARDIITPIYHAINLKTGESFDYYGEEYKIPVPMTAGIFTCLKEEGKTVDGKLEEYFVYNFILTDVYGDTYDTCYRMYKKTKSGGYVYYEHIDMCESLYSVADIYAAQADAMALKDWLKGKDATETEKEINSAAKSEGMSFKLAADGDILVYEYTLVDSSYARLTADEVEAAFKPTKKAKDTMRDVCKAFETDYGIRLGGIRETFYAADGTELYSVDIENK